MLLVEIGGRILPVQACVVTGQESLALLVSVPPQLLDTLPFPLTTPAAPRTIRPRGTSPFPPAFGTSPMLAHYYTP